MRISLSSTGRENARVRERVHGDANFSTHEFLGSLPSLAARYTHTHTHTHTGCVVSRVYRCMIQHTKNKFVHCT